MAHESIPQPTPPVKTWTYQELTQATEERLRSLMAMTQGKNEEESRFFKQWAYGVYLLWEKITLASVEDINDIPRLAEIFDPEYADELRQRNHLPVKAEGEPA